MTGTFGYIVPSVCLSWEEAQCTNCIWSNVTRYALTLEHSSNVIGNSSMVKWRMQFLPMLLHWGERMLTYICSLTLTMLVTSWHDDCIWVSWYISIWHWLFGIWRSNPQSKLACLVLSLLLWSKAWRHCEAYNTNYEWWEFKSMDHPIFMVIICLWYIIPNDLNWHWRRSPTQCATTRYVSQLL
jgi:hypothetical protein